MKCGYCGERKSLIYEKGRKRFVGNFYLLPCTSVRHSQFFAALSATRSQYATTISRLHTLTETMLVVSFSVVGLECSFHCVMLFFV